MEEKLVEQRPWNLQMALLFLNIWMQVEVNFAHISNSIRRRGGGLEWSDGRGAYQKQSLSEV